jgi:hypothetical protein
MKLMGCINDRCGIKNYIDFGFGYMTQLQIIDFQKRWGLSSHLGGVFSVDLTLERQFNIIIDNFVPLLYRELSELTFLQRSH